MKRTINITLSTQSITAAIQALAEYKQWYERKTRELNERLAVLASSIAAQRFANAQYDGTNDVTITANPTARGWEVVAEGTAVCFIEFGAGVFHNGTEPYPKPRPAGVAGIGQYGGKQGNHAGWAYTGDPGTNGIILEITQNGPLVFTRGNPAAMPMFYAKEETQAQFVAIARQVFA